MVDIAQKTGGDGVAKRDFSDIIEARDLSKNQKTALLLREHAMASALYVVDALVRAGIIKIMTPQARAAEKVALNGKTLAESKTLLLGDDAKKTSVAEGKNLTFEGVDLNSHLSVMQKLAFPEDALVGADKTALQKELVAQRDQSLLWLSTLLGLTKSSTLKPATLVQNLVLRGLYPASFLVLESRPALNIPNLSSFKFSTLANERRLANAYSSKAQSFQTRYRIVLSELQHSVTRRYIGKALSHVVGGQSNMRVDLLLTTRK